MNKKITVVAVLLAFILTGCQEKTVQVDKEIIDSEKAFSLDMYQTIAEETNENIFLSPLSIQLALAMTVNGADGETKQVMNETLHVANQTEDQMNERFQSLLQSLQQIDDVALSSAQSIYVQENRLLTDQFKEATETYYEAYAKNVDFGKHQTVDDINDWVETNTDGYIDQLLKQRDPDIVVMLLNAMAFNGTWQYEFDEQKTYEGTFLTGEDDKTSVSMMRQKASYPYIKRDTYEAVTMPYGEGRIAMTAFLPNDTSSLEALINNMTLEGLQNDLQQKDKQEMTVHFPKFTMTYEQKLNDTLMALGMNQAFDVGEADFSRMLQDGSSLYIDEVRHKTFIEVDEKGTEAAAVTSVAMNETAAVGREIKFNQPFLFVIHDRETGAILFMGQLTNIE